MVPKIPINHVVITAPLDAICLDKINDSFKDGTVTYCPDGMVPIEVYKSVDIFFTTWTGPPQDLVTFDETPNLKHVQLTSSGSEKVQNHKAFLEQSSRTGERQVSMSNASGIHVLSIPPWVIGNIVNLYYRMNEITLAGKLEQKWRTDHGPNKGNYQVRTIKGKTVGMLGYGHIGRETARLASAFGVNIIAANSTGQASVDNGYIFAGTGDPKGILPTAWYSTRDQKSFHKFLSQTDILIASLPSTKDTKGMLTSERMAMLPKDAIIINVGRGDLFTSEDLLENLNNGHLWGAALDVTNPEPLPDFHPLWTHPKIIITPHLSGNTERECELAADIMLENVKHMREGKELYNLVIEGRGY